MKESTIHTIPFLTCLHILHVVQVTAAPPNILVFLADDLGSRDIGIYGNKTIRTPNIDSIGYDGVQFTHHISAATMCTPSRAALLTGRYPARTGIEAGPIRVLMHLASSTGLPPWEITLAEQAKSVGYKTALFGKWHLGLYDLYRNPVYHPLNQGFDVFYGIPFSNIDGFGEDQPDDFVCYLNMFIPQILGVFLSATLPLLFLYKTAFVGGRFLIFILFLMVTLMVVLVYNLSFRCAFHSVLMRQFDVVEQPIRIRGLTKRLVKESVQFLEQRKQNGDPFMVVMAWHLVKTVLEPMIRFQGHSTHGIYGDCIEELDWGIGEVLSALDRLGFRDNTLVYFTSDHGALLDFDGTGNGGSNGVFKGGKAWGAVEGGHRVPGLIRWPYKLRRGIVIREPTHLMDFFPTVSELIGAGIPTDRHIDGHSLVPLLMNRSRISPHEFIMHYCGGELHAVTYRPRDTDLMVWKVAFRFPDLNVSMDDCLKYWPFKPGVCSCEVSRPRDPPYLFDLTSDPGESNPVEESVDGYKEIIDAVKNAVRYHKLSMNSTIDELSFYKVMWKPHLQICCNFPFCRCEETFYNS